MDVGPQRIGSEMLFPKSRSELGDTSCGVFTDPLQHIDEVSIGIYTVQPASDDQALDHPDVFGTEFGPAE